MLALAWAAQDWVQRPATITFLELECDEGSERVVATYTYDFEGRPFTGDRVALQTASDNFGPFHRDLYNRLNSERKSGKPSICFVDPNQPDQSLLHRDLRLAVVVFHVPFVVAFGLFGFGGIIGVAIYAIQQNRRRSRLARYPGQPWRMRDDWAEGEIQSVRWKPVAAIGAFALLWNSIVFPFPFLVFAGNTPSIWLVLFVALFVLVGLGLIGITVQQAFKTFGHGRSILRLACTPGVVGGELVGAALVPDTVLATRGFRATLACVENQTVTSQGESESQDVTIWEDTRFIIKSLKHADGKMGVPLRFIVPSDCKPTDPDAEDPVKWILQIEAETTGRPFSAEFEVPVFVTSDSRPGVKATSEKLTKYEVIQSLPQSLGREGLLANQPAKDQLEIYSPPFRNGGASSVLVVVGLVFVAVGVGFLGWAVGFERVLFGGMFTLMGILAALIGILSTLRWVKLTVDGEDWRIESGLRFLNRRTMLFSAWEIKHIDTKRKYQATAGAGEMKTHNDVVARLQGKRKVVLVRGIKDRGIERRLLDELRRLADLGDVNDAKIDQGLKS